MKKTRFKSNFSNFFRVEYFALLISCLAIWSTYNQNKTNREFYELSVKPLLIHSKIIAPNLMGLKIDNDGLGVAIVDSISVNYNGNKSSGQEVFSVIRALNKDMDYRGYGWGSKNKVTIKVGTDAFWIFKLESDEDPSELNKKFNPETFQVFEDIQVTLYYRDLYENQHRYSF